jgi:hypothetical protein
MASFSHRYPFDLEDVPILLAQGAGTWYSWPLTGNDGKELLMSGPDRRKIREWMMAECLRRRSAGVGDETLFVWMMGEGYNEMESLSMLAEALGWNGAGLRAQPFWPRLSPDQKVGLIRASRGDLPARIALGRRNYAEKGKGHGKGRKED